jgi:signal transduction histidine kinase
VPFTIRPLGAALALSLILAGIGFGWSRVRFGADDAAAARLLETEIRDRVDARARALETLALNVAAEPALVDDALKSADGLSTLFARLAALVGGPADAALTATVYVPGGAAGYRVLAWSDGPAGEVALDRLNGPAALFVAPGTTGLRATGVRLVYVHPLEAAGRRVAVVETETVLSRATPDGIARMATSLGPVTILPNYIVGDMRPTSGFVVSSDRGAALVEVHFDPQDLRLARAAFLRRVLGTAALPLGVALLWLAGPALERRRRARPLRAWLGWSTASVALIAGALVVLERTLVAFAAPHPLIAAAHAAIALAAAALVAGGLAWRRIGRRSARGQPVRFLIETLTAGAALAGAAVATAHWMSAHITAGTLASWRSALFPFSIVNLVDIWSVLVVVLAITWAIASALAIAAARWRIHARRPIGWVAVGLWLAPAAVAVSAGAAWLGVPAVPTFILAAAIATAALFATDLRRYFRHTTQAMRLVVGFLALLAPLLAVYPLIASIAERTIRMAIEHDYGPATAGQADRLREQVAHAEQEIDLMSALPEQVRAAVAREPVDSQLAFSVWRETSLSRTRVISDIELYGRARTLVSRFAMNFPEYVGRTAAQTWAGSGCEWQVSGEVTRFGAVDRPMLHATRGLCDEAGNFVGAVVIHVAPNDYQALPFLAAANPYSEVFDVEAAATAPPPDLELVVYGWSLRPLFLSGRVAWSIDASAAARLYRDGVPFWTPLEADGRRFNVYLLQNRAGIYALGYPRTTLFEHAARLAEIGAVTAVLFVVIQVGALIYAPLARRRVAPVRVLLREIRTSFYRKLFLFFVLVAIGPVFLFALIFGGYMAAKFRADVEAQASVMVNVARRVVEQVASGDARPSTPTVLPTDDVMVWIRQVIGQDVNLFDGPELRATSQRDLFNSGLLPTRTPAIVFRRIVLDRLPWFVAEDQETLVAATPVLPGEPQRILTVPLVSRQREIEEEMDELGRGVLVGSVFVVLLAAALGAWLASRVADPVARLTKAARQIAAGRLDVQIAADTADELRRLVDDFNRMAATLVAQRAELARTNQLQAWNEMARQVAHEIKNPLTPIQLAAEHLQRVHDDRGRPLGAPFDQCVRAILGQVRLLRQIASEFANFAGNPTSRPEAVSLAALVESVIGPYRLGLSGTVDVHVDLAADLPRVLADRTLLTRALTNLVENAIQAMPTGGALTVTGAADAGRVVLRLADTGVGMDADARARAFEPYFSTKTAGSGLGLANARRNIERDGGTIAIESAPGAGATVTITLPRADGDAASGPAPSR